MMAGPMETRKQKGTGPAKPLRLGFPVMLFLAATSAWVPIPAEAAALTVEARISLGNVKD